MLEIVHYRKADGSIPFQEWMRRLRDRQAKARIDFRILQLEKGNFGDSKPVGEGIVELRVNVGAGYRVYCGRYGQHWVILLCGGDKDSQDNDMSRAKAFWADWKQRQP